MKKSTIITGIIAIVNALLTFVLFVSFRATQNAAYAEWRDTNYRYQTELGELKSRFAINEDGTMEFIKIHGFFKKGLIISEKDADKINIEVNGDAHQIKDGNAFVFNTNLNSYFFTELGDSEYYERQEFIGYVPEDLTYIWDKSKVPEKYLRKYFEEDMDTLEELDEVSIPAVNNVYRQYRKGFASFGLSFITLIITAVFGIITFITAKKNNVSIKNVAKETVNKVKNTGKNTYTVYANGSVLYTCYSLEEANNYVNTFAEMNGYTIDSEIVEIKYRDTKAWSIVIVGAGIVEIVSNIPRTIETKISNVFITVATKPKAAIYGDYSEIEIKKTKIFSGKFEEAKKFANDWVTNNAPSLANTWVVNDENPEEIRLKVSEFTLPDGTVKRNFIEIQQEIVTVENKVENN